MAVPCIRLWNARHAGGRGFKSGRGLIPRIRTILVVSRPALVMEELGDVEHLERVPHLAPGLRVPVLPSDDACPYGQHRSNRWQSKRPESSAGSWCGIRQLEAIVMNNRRRKGDQFQECSIPPSLGRSLARPKKRYAQL